MKWVMALTAFALTFSAHAKDQFKEFLCATPFVTKAAAEGLLDVKRSDNYLKVTAKDSETFIAFYDAISVDMDKVMKDNCASDQTGDQISYVLYQNCMKEICKLRVEATPWN